MKSTGEVMGVGRTFGEAFAKSQQAAGSEIPRSGLAFISVRDTDKAAAGRIGKGLAALGFQLCATHGTAAALRDAGLECRGVNKVREGQPHIVDMLKNDEIALIVNTTDGKQAVSDSYSIRRTALQHRVFYMTTIAGAQATVNALRYLDQDEVNCLQHLHDGTG
jgi:carbamoyl-phosphate synthase large subunit